MLTQPKQCVRDVIFPFMLIFYIQGYLISSTCGCILLLNGWTPISIKDRATLAEVLVRATALKTFKDKMDLNTNTYSGEFKVHSILKGERILSEIRSSDDTYIISNFGDKTLCYADVMEGEEYILFLTLYGNRLSGKYDDLFGAAELYSDSLEEEILEALGWRPWSAWSACGASCASGTQTRARDCSGGGGGQQTTDPAGPECEGQGETQQRRCNSFTCKGLKNLKRFISENDYRGLEKSEGRPTALIFTRETDVNFPVSRIYSNAFPKSFSLLVTAKPVKDNTGHIVSVSDLLGSTQLALQVGREPMLTYMDAGGKQRIITFNTNLSDGNWHQFALSITSSSITLHVDCSLAEAHARDPEVASGPARLPPNAVVSVGKLFYGSSKYPPFEGYIDELMISSDPQAAKQQCDDKLVPITDLPHNTETIPTTPAETPRTPTEDKQVQISWTAWSPCSASCGPRGVQTRTAYCAGEGVTLDRCYDLARGALQQRHCRVQRCPPRNRVPRCRRRSCRNGGVCKPRSGRCRCRHGYFGKHCHLVSCRPGCYHGGYCAQPDTCACPRGWTGPRCDTAVCEPACLNGGRCVSPGVCACPYGYLPPYCSAPCNLLCKNGGVCVGNNECRCAPGHTGKFCEQVICMPGCQNGGSCLYPFFCLCPPGTYGHSCEKFICQPMCLHGGTCIGLNTCACPAGFSGRLCERADCPYECYNGAHCVNGRCECQMGYYGMQCERRQCVRMEVPVPRTVTEPYRAAVTYPCGLLGWRTCTKHRTLYRLAYYTEQKSVYRCR